jgi:hypothetical protein
MSNRIMRAAMLSLLVVMTAALGLRKGFAPQKQDQAGAWLKTRQRLILLSANDGQAHLRFDAERKIDKTNFTQDSITAIQLGPDHPPIIETIYGAVPNTILGAPYLAMTRDGRYALVPCHGTGLLAPKQKDLLSVIDLSSPHMPAVQKVSVPMPQMASAHPDGKHLIVACATGFQVFAMQGGRLILEKDNKIGSTPQSMDISPKGDRIVAALARSPDGGPTSVHVFGYKQGTIEDLHEVLVPKGLPPFDTPFALRFSPDGKRVLVPNGGGSATKGRLDDVLSIDMTLDPAVVTEVIPQVADGIESLAFHPTE